MRLVLRTRASLVSLPAWADMPFLPICACSELHNAAEAGDVELVVKLLSTEAAADDDFNPVRPAHHLTAACYRTSLRRCSSSAQLSRSR